MNNRVFLGTCFTYENSNSGGKENITEKRNWKNGYLGGDYAFCILVQYQICISNILCIVIVYHTYDCRKISAKKKICKRNKE